MDKKRFLWILSLPLLLLGGCDRDGIEDDIPEVPGKGGDIVFDIGFAPQGGDQSMTGPQTRVATSTDFNSTWEDGDEIGVFAVAHGDPLAASGNPIHNAKLTYTDGAWSGEASWPDNVEKLDFYAYYPYDATAANPTAIAFNVQTDQSTTTNTGSTDQSNYNLSDLLTAKSDNDGSGYDKTTTAVPLTFSHALAMVQVSVPSGGKGFGPSPDLTVKLRGVKAGAVVNLNGIDATTPGSEITISDTGNDPIDIIMHRVEQPDDENYETSYTYRTLVPAQEIVQGNPLFSFEYNGQRLSANNTSASPLTLAGGNAQTFTCSLPQLVHTVLVSKGTFQMGSPDSDVYAHDSEKPQHWVRLTNDFYISKYQVTNAQYAAFLNAKGIGEDGKGSVNYNENGSAVNNTKSLIYKSSDDRDWGLHYNTDKWEPANGYEDHPVINVTWYGAKAYADWVGGTLPTEAQWEYTCRAGTTTPWATATGTSSDLKDYAWYLSNTTHEVGTRKANPWGLYDMYGNVWEWCLDQWSYSSNYPTTTTEDTPEENPLVIEGDNRILRGGSCKEGVMFIRSAQRNCFEPDEYDYNIGFRVIFPVP